MLSLSLISNKSIDKYIVVYLLFNLLSNIVTLMPKWLWFQLKIISIFRFKKIIRITDCAWSEQSFYFLTHIMKSKSGRFHCVKFKLTAIQFHILISAGSSERTLFDGGIHSYMDELQYGPSLREPPKKRRFIFVWFGIIVTQEPPRCCGSKSNE